MTSLRAFAGGIPVTVGLAGAIASYAAGRVWLGNAFVAFGLLGLVLTLVKWLPLLHRLPLVGAIPPPEVAFRLQIPGGGMTHEINPGAEALVVLCAEVAGGRRAEITRVLVNAYVVGATNIYRTDPHGTPYTNGGQRGKTPDGFYRSISDVTIPLGALVMYFKVTIPGPGNYEVVLTLQSPDFHDKGDHYYRDTLIARSKSPSEE
jgi:hypothetical protein